MGFQGAGLNPRVGMYACFLSGLKVDGDTNNVEGFCACGRVRICLEGVLRAILKHSIFIGMKRSFVYWLYGSVNFAFLILRSWSQSLKHFLSV